MIAFASICDGQTASIGEKLPDGSYVVLIDGVEFRAITGDRAVELAKQKVELAACRDEQVKLTTAYDLAKKDVTIAQQETKIEHGNFVRVMQLYEKERELRTESMNQFIPHGKVGGFGGKFLNFLDSGYGQSLFKLVLPTAQFIKVMRN